MPFLYKGLGKRSVQLEPFCKIQFKMTPLPPHESVANRWHGSLIKGKSPLGPLPGVIITF